MDELNVELPVEQTSTKSLEERLNDLEIEVFQIYEMISEIRENIADTQRMIEENQTKIESVQADLILEELKEEKVKRVPYQYIKAEKAMLAASEDSKALAGLA